MPILSTVLGPLAFVCLNGEPDSLAAQLPDLARMECFLDETHIEHVSHPTREGNFNWKTFPISTDRAQRAFGPTLDHWYGFPNISILRLPHALITAHTQPVGMERSIVHADVFRITAPSSETTDSENPNCERLGDAYLRDIVAIAEEIHGQIVDPNCIGCREDCIIQWKFNQWYLDNLLKHHHYPDQVIFGRPGLDSNAGVNSGPF
jgi:hypothetical protein